MLSSCMHVETWRLLLPQVEAMKHGFAVRTALGDPGTSEAPFEHADSIHAAVSDLLSNEFVSQLKRITLDNGVIADDKYGGR